jgi:hypothetical protein
MFAFDEQRLEPLIAGDPADAELCASGVKHTIAASAAAASGSAHGRTAYTQNRLPTKYSIGKVWRKRIAVHGQHAKLAGDARIEACSPATTPFLSLVVPTNLGKMEVQAGVQLWECLKARKASPVRFVRQAETLPPERVRALDLCKARVATLPEAPSIVRLGHEGFSENTVRSARVRRILSRERRQE